MATTPDLAVLALRVYSTPTAADGANVEFNRPAIPAGWTEREQDTDDGTGFSCGVYSNGSEIVVSYAGTNEDGQQPPETDGDVVDAGASNDRVQGGAWNVITIDLVAACAGSTKTKGRFSAKYSFMQQHRPRKTFATGISDHRILHYRKFKNLAAQSPAGSLGVV